MASIDIIAEDWILRRMDENMIHAAEFWFHRRMQRISSIDKRTNSNFAFEIIAQVCKLIILKSP